MGADVGSWGGGRGGRGASEEAEGILKKKKNLPSTGHENAAQPQADKLSA